MVLLVLAPFRWTSWKATFMGHVVYRMPNAILGVAAEETVAARCRDMLIVTRAVSPTHQLRPDWCVRRGAASSAHLL
jgi:hypothetical protein